MTGATGAQVARAASALVGTPFRLHGRDPASGVDCVGLAWLALQAAGIAVQLPRAYALRNSDISQHLALVDNARLACTSGQYEPGDIVLVACGAAQFHLLIAGFEGAFVHAHAGLRRVVVMPGPLPWPVLAQWRPSSAKV